MFSQLLFCKPEERKKAPWIAFVRMFLGFFWLYELTIGHNWKTGWFISGPHPGWFGPNAGSYLIEQGTAGMKAGGWAWFGWVLENIMYPYAAVWGYFAVAVQIILAFSFLIGFCSRPLAVMGLGMDFFIFMLGNSRIPPFFSVGHLFVLATNAGVYYGLDGFLLKRLAEVNNSKAKFLRYILNFEFITPAVRILLASGSVILAVYYLLKTGVLPSEKMRLVSMDLAVLFGFVASGLYIYKDKMNTTALAAGFLRIFIGYRFLHEIFIRVVPELNGIPGWGTKAQLLKVFQDISANHWDIIARIVDSLFIPAVGFWALVFAIVQTLVGVMLILGYKTRLASRVGIVYLALLIILGFTRYTPFLFGYLFGVMALDGGMMLSLDSLKVYKEKIGINLSYTTSYLFLGIAVVSAIAAMMGGILPDGYKTSMGPVMGAMAAILTALIGISGLLQKDLEKGVR